jgi:hypothetical protein
MKKTIIWYKGDGEFVTNDGSSPDISDAKCFHDTDEAEEHIMNERADNDSDNYSLLEVIRL